jgi:hypothetical protein
MGDLRLGRRMAPVLVLVVMLVTAAGQAAPERIAACAAPKPLPASVKRPPKGASATQLANFLLALPQRKPCDVSLFTSMFDDRGTNVPGFYPEGRRMTPAPGPVPTEAQVRSQLKIFLKGSPGAAAALALFDRADVEAKLPDPTLRAALAALRGTVAEPMIEDFLSRSYAALPRFCNCLPKALMIAATTGGNLPGTRVIFFNARYQSEHFALLNGILAHEVLHHDSPPASATEELILHTLTAIVHMQVLSRQPTLATSGTELARYMNSLALMLVNSRVPGSWRSAIIAPRGRGTVPASAKSQRDLYAHAKDFHFLGRSASPDDSSPAPPVFAAVLRKLLAPGVALPKPLTYSKKTAELFSKLNDTWLSPVDRLRVSVLLGLVSMDEIVKYTGLPRAKVITMFKLAPILALK